MYCIIQAENYSLPFGKGSCAWLWIDGQPIEAWIDLHVSESDAKLLALAQMWLINDEDDQLANARIKPAEVGSSTIVPLLVCRDDMDFNCSVLVVEQFVGSDTVEWRRFGLSLSWGVEVGISTQWLESDVSPRFRLADFNAALLRLDELKKAPAQ